MVKKEVVFGVICISLILILSLSIVSAGWWTDFVGRITGKAVRASNTCVDSDFGINYSAKGVATVTAENGSSQNWTDACRFSKLYEVYCNTSKFEGYSTMIYSCVIGQICSDGACVSNQTTQVGNLYVTSNPSDASLYFDKSYRGQTPQTISNLGVGYYVIDFVKTGYKNYSAGAYVVVGNNSLNVDLIVQTGSLSVTTTPTGAKLYIDNSYKGLTPRTVSSLSIGNHTVQVSKVGYLNYTTTKYVSAGSNALNLTLFFCSDSDSSNNPLIKGAIQNVTNVYYDYCRDVGSTMMLYQGNCAGANVVWNSSICGGGKVCSNGICG